MLMIAVLAGAAVAVVSFAAGYAYAKYGVPALVNLGLRRLAVLVPVLGALVAVLVIH
jgi:hypothetical protein